MQYSGLQVWAADANSFIERETGNLRIRFAMQVNEFPAISISLNFSILIILRAVRMCIAIKNVNEHTSRSG